MPGPSLSRFACGGSPDARVSRRALLRGLALAPVAGSAALLTGCGLRWESDAPELPVLARDRHPGADALRAELDRVVAARAAASAADDALAAAANAAQIDALTQRLVAVHDMRTATPTDPAPGTAATGPASRQNPDQARARALETQWSGLDAEETVRTANSGADEHDLLLLAAVQVCRQALGVRFGGRPSALSPDDGIAAVSAESAGPLLERARHTAYVLDVCAARVPAAREAVATGSRAAAHGLLADLDPADTSAPPLGYPLDPPSTPAQVEALAVSALAALSDSIVAAMPAEWARLGADPDPAATAGGGGGGGEAAVNAFTALRRRAAECEHWHTAWSGTVRSLPGLR